MGVISISTALNLAREANLDLVEIVSRATPPVVKLIDYGKFKYDETIKQRNAKRNQNRVELKEIRFRLKIDNHDFETKETHARKFLQGGDKVKVTIMLRGRERAHPIGGKELLFRLAQAVADISSIENQPRQDGRDIYMILAPKAKKVHSESEQRRRGEEAKAERLSRQAAHLLAKDQKAQAEKKKEENDAQVKD